MRFHTKLFLFSLFLSFTTYIFVLSVDPYDKFKLNPWKLKTKAVSSYRDNKFYQIDNTNIKYDMFILGSSRVQRFNPDLFEQLTGYKTYNYGVNNAKPEDLLAITKHILNKQRPKSIFLQLDFYNLNKNIPMDHRLRKSPLKNYLEKSFVAADASTFPFEKSYFTSEALYDSVKAVMINKTGTLKITHKPNGMMVKKEPQKIIKLAHEYFTNEYKDYTIDEVRINYLRNIKTLCEKNDIKLIVSISPMNKEHLSKVLSNEKLRRNFINYKRIIVDIYGEVIDFNTISASSYNYPYWQDDSVHPSEHFSELMTKIVLQHEIEKNDIGILLNKNNIEKVLLDYKGPLDTL